MSRHCRAIASALLVLLLLVCRSARADSRRLEWNEAWPRFRPGEYVATGLLVAGSFALEFATEQPERARWVGPLPGDGLIREALVGRERKTRQQADFFSDTTWMAAQFYPQVIDAVAVTYFGDDFNFDVAWQLSWMNLQTLAAGFVLTRGSHRLFGRERPLRHSCGSDASYDELCPFEGTNASFISGHTSMAFVGAGLTCVHHRYLPLYGGGSGDGAACAAVLGVATVTGVLRLVADRHYASDVVVGAILGFGVGYGLPWLLHYRHGAPAGERGDVSAPLVSWSAQF